MFLFAETTTFSPSPLIMDGGEAPAPTGNSIQDQIVELLKSGELSTSSIAKSLGKPAAAVNSPLQSLLARGMVKSNRTDTGIIWKLP